MLKKCKIVMSPHNEGIILKDSIKFQGVENAKLSIYQKGEIEEDEKFEGNRLPYKLERQHLYIISDDEIKEGDWCIKLNVNSVLLVDCKENEKLANELNFNYKKIIATTDSSLKVKTSIGNQGTVMFSSLPQPSQSFIEVFVREYNKGNVITDILVEYECFWCKPKKANIVCLGYTNKGKEHCRKNLKINLKDNTITIKKVKDSWSREEVIELIEKALFDSSDLITKFPNGSVSTIVKDGTYGLNNWIEENL